MVGRALPAVERGRAADEHVQSDHRGGRVEVEVHDAAALPGAAPQLAEAVHPRMAPFRHPALAGLNRHEPE